MNLPVLLFDDQESVIDLMAGAFMGGVAVKRGRKLHDPRQPSYFYENNPLNWGRCSEAFYRKCTQDWEHVAGQSRRVGMVDVHSQKQPYNTVFTSWNEWPRHLPNRVQREWGRNFAPDYYRTELTGEALTMI